MRVLHDVRQRIESDEARLLGPMGKLARDSAGRKSPEADDPVRTCFQRDRDRILHSKAFRRLKHKTQVFIDPTGDHYRTRLTHTLEVAQISRTVGRALRVNEDLIEAIALGHDLGHTPFGHAGESALDEAIRELNAPNGPVRFRHYEQSLRIVDVLENLNLTEEVRAGISGHSKGRNDLTEGDSELSATTESAVVRVCDRIAYLNHDLDDAIRSGMIAEIPSQFSLPSSHSMRIGMMVEDLIENSLVDGKVRLSEEMRELLNSLKEWLFENVYLEYPVRFPEIRKAQNCVAALLRHFCEEGNLPADFYGVQGAVDYVSGMTDRFAIDTFRTLAMPSVWGLR
jgi:dGTPase